MIKERHKKIKTLLNIYKKNNENFLSNYVIFAYIHFSYLLFFLR